MYTTCIHYMYTTGALQAHYMYTTCTLHVHYRRTTCTLLVHYLYTTFTLHAHCRRTQGFTYESRGHSGDGSVFPPLSREFIKSDTAPPLAQLAALPATTEAGALPTADLDASHAVTRMGFELTWPYPCKPEPRGLQG